MGMVKTCGVLLLLVGCTGAGPSAGSSSSGASANASSSGASASSSSGGGHTVTGSRCPRVVLGSSLPAELMGDTTGGPDFLTSPRLEWTDAPDDAVEFTAPTAGDYVIELESTVEALGVSAEDYNTNGSDAFPFTRSACPAEGASTEINGVYSHNQPNYPLTMTAGQSVMLFVSAPYWAPVKAGPYTLRVRKLP